MKQFGEREYLLGATEPHHYAKPQSTTPGVRFLPNFSNRGRFSVEPENHNVPAAGVPSGGRNHANPFQSSFTALLNWWSAAITHAALTPYAVISLRRECGHKRKLTCHQRYPAQAPRRVEEHWFGLGPVCMHFRTRQHIKQHMPGNGNSAQQPPSTQLCTINSKRLFLQPAKPRYNPKLAPSPAEPSPPYLSVQN